MDLFTASGRVCQGTLRRFGVDEAVEWDNPQGSEADWPTTQEESGTSAVLVAEVRPDKVCKRAPFTWARMAALPQVDLYRATTAVGPTIGEVVAKARRKFKQQYREYLREDYRYMGDPPFGAHLRDKAIRILHWASEKSGHPLLTVSASRGGRYCDTAFGHGAGYATADGNHLGRRLFAREDALRVRGAADLDADGWPELILWSYSAIHWVEDGTILVFSDGGRYTRRVDLRLHHACN